MESWICKCGKECVVSEEDRKHIEQGEEWILLCTGTDEECGYQTVIEKGVFVEYLPPRMGERWAFRPYG